MGISLPELFRFRNQIATLSRQEQAVPDGVLLSRISDTVTLDAFTGADMTCAVLFPQPTKEQLIRAGLNPDTYKYPTLKTFAELQTLTVSSARSVTAIRRLGEAHVHKYVKGGRTIAGSMIFTNFNRDVFADFYRLHPSDVFTNSSIPFHIDQLPEFHIIISAANEYGTFANMALINVTLTNFGTTMSIHDLLTESTYTYVAQLMFPFVSQSLDFSNIINRAVNAISGTTTIPLSTALSVLTDSTIAGHSPAFGFDDVIIQGSYFEDEGSVYHRWKDLRRNK
jgi:hypothetical protein